MTWSDIAQLITAVAALGALVSSLRNKQKIQDIHLSINSRMDQLLKATGAEQRLIGGQEERDRAGADIK
jgi:hypothetical protein